MTPPPRSDNLGSGCWVLLSVYIVMSAFLCNLEGELLPIAYLLL